MPHDEAQKCSTRIACQTMLELPILQLVLWDVISNLSQKHPKGAQRDWNLGGQFMTEKSEECSSNQAVAKWDLWEVLVWGKWSGVFHPGTILYCHFRVNAIQHKSMDITAQRILRVRVSKILNTAKRKHPRPWRCTVPTETTEFKAPWAWRSQVVGIETPTVLLVSKDVQPDEHGTLVVRSIYWLHDWHSDSAGW